MKLEPENKSQNVGPILRTSRLLLRRWQPADLEKFAAMNADLRVMEHFRHPLRLDESDAMVTRIEDQFERLGYGLWAMEVLGDDKDRDQGGDQFIGFTGLIQQTFAAPFTPCMEISWRLAFPFWKKGYVTEAAQAVLKFAFMDLELSEVVSMTVPANTRSTAVMKRLGMTHDPRDDFDHPRVPDGHALKRHVLYRLGKEDWLSMNGGG